jgi:hypothetical protein
MAIRESTAPVTALLPASAAGLRGAVEAQEHAPEMVLEVDAGGLLAAAAGVRAPGWAWVLDGSALPRPGALAELLAAARDAAEAGLPAPAVLASVVLADDGEPAAGHAAWFRRGGSDLAMLAARRHLLPIRAARAGSLLIATPAAPPRGGDGALNWTARLLRDATGYAVPASEADAAGAGAWRADALGRNPREDARRTAAALVDGAWAPKEKLWLAAEAASRARAALTARRA